MWLEVWFFKVPFRFDLFWFRLLWIHFPLKRMRERDQEIRTEKELKEF